MICGDEDEVETFEGFFILELEWMISWVTLFFLQGFLADIADVVTET